MLNKRKALIGYAVYAVTKPLAKRAMRTTAKSAKGKRAAMVAALGAAVGGLLFWRKRKKSDAATEG
jgi:uncharacterized protein HemX